uniref:HTH_48 domain-containing protein n=1 Tax=Strongyloides papillosus TaxID=174720 RepID=A0A0N5CAF0_STREA
MDFQTIYLYEFKLGQTAAKTSRKINEAFGQGSTNKRTVQHWFQKFRNGDTSLRRKEGFREVSVLENEKLKRMVKRNPRITVRELAGELGNCDGIIHNKFINPGETMTSDRYCKEIEEMNQKLSVLKPALVNRRGPILLHDNAKPHVLRITVQKLTELGYETLPHPPYSPDLSSTDYHLFKELELHLRQKKFSKSDDLKNDVLEFLDSRDRSFYSNGINKLVSRWQQCVDCNGTYFK